MSNESNVSTSITSAFSTNDQDVQMFLTIPGKMMFDEMLRQLAFPLAQYQHRFYEDHKVSVTIVFHTSKLSSQGSPATMTVSGVRSMDVAVAEHTAALAAIRYLENATNTVIRDLNYNQLREVGEENIRLKHQLVDVRNQLKQAATKSKKLARGWFLSVRSMFSFSVQFHNVAVLGNFGAQEFTNNNVRAILANIYGAARLLRSKSARLEAKLEEVRTHP